MSDEHREPQEQLKLFVFNQDGEYSTHWMLLGIVLELYHSRGNPPDFQSIYETAVQKRGHTVSKTWIHRMLKKLVDIGIIRVIDEHAYRKKYITDVDSITTGLEQLKIKRLTDMSDKIRRLQTEKEDLERINPYVIAQQIVSTHTGSTKVNSSLFATGVEDVHKLIVYTLINMAQPGDIIRATVVRMNPFERGVYDRTKDFIDAAKRGVNVRYLAAGNLFRGEEELAARVAQQDMGPMLQEIFELTHKQNQFEVRIARDIITYNHVCINNERLILMVNEDPLTAALITRDINSDMIDNVVTSFDALWNGARPLHQMSPADLVEFGLGDSSRVSSEILSKSSIITNDDRQK